MRRIFSRLTFALAVVACVQPASAQTLLDETFQSGDIGSWRGDPGRGDIQLTEYAGNWSLRLRRDAWAGRTIPGEIAAGETLLIEADLAADGLEKSDACILEVSAGGQPWEEVGRIGYGQDDGVTLTTVSGEIAGPLAQLAIRVRSDGNAGNDTCWADNIRAVRIAPLPTEPDDRAALEKILAGDGTPSGLLPMNIFALSPGADAPVEALQGQLTLIPDPRSIQARVVTDRFGYANGSAPHRELPEMTIDLVSSGSHVVPDKRRLVISENPHWDTIVTAGRVWSLPGDQASWRTVLPFALVEKNANCVHNGLVVFDTLADGSTSPAYWQIASETCAYFQFDAWGLMRVDLDAGPVPDAAALAEGYRQEAGDRLPVYPVERMAVDFPGIETDAFGAASDVAPNDMTLYGLTVDGRHYASECGTRAGPMPLCEELVIPSYSFAKSMFAGLGMMRLEQLYPGAMQALIADYVPACASEGSWDDVSFGDALNMATGHYKSATPDADEDASVDQEFFVTTSHERKLALACRQFPRRTEPGKTFVYHTSDTYLLGTAMQAFLQEKQGPGADIYRDLLVEPLWQPLGLSQVLDETRRSEPSGVSQPFTGWGLFMQRGDLAKLLEFLGSADGQIDGEQVLAKGPLRQALQEEGDNESLPAAEAPLFYRNGFWAFDIQSYGDCEAPTRIPFMSGFGGLVAAIIPNGVSYYYISDGGAYRWAGAALETSKISDFCKEGRP
ncbi:serine hydrolase [Henriciella sp.]|uniref:serine hydrolase n=1 Tax=Henriciella sp. TaxID=1968823 RepID=UPI00260309EF|nr:serine hydrolase [Henriciella sp.]